MVQNWPGADSIQFENDQDIEDDRIDDLRQRIWTDYVNIDPTLEMLLIFADETGVNLYDQVQFLTKLQESPIFEQFCTDPVDCIGSVVWDLTEGKREFYNSKLKDIIKFLNKYNIDDNIEYGSLIYLGQALRAYAIWRRFQVLSTLEEQDFMNAIEIILDSNMINIFFQIGQQTSKKFIMSLINSNLCYSLANNISPLLYDPENLEEICIMLENVQINYEDDDVKVISDVVIEYNLIISQRRESENSSAPTHTNIADTPL